MFTVEPQGCAAGSEHLQTRSNREQLRYLGCRLKNLLEVVEHEEQPPLAKVVFEALIEGLLSCLPHPQRLCQGREEQFGFGQGGERHEESAIGEVIQKVCGCLQGKSCLADPAWSGEGEQACLVATQEVVDLGHFLLAPYKRSGL